MVLVESLLFAMAGFVVGIIIMKILLDKTNLAAYLFKEERKRRRVLTNPDKLQAKLKESGWCLIDGKWACFDVEVVDGKKQIKQVMRLPPESKS